jgi:ergothioneine biosynthesis protein EgtB
VWERPIPERHRIFFYRGHLEAFDWNLLRPHLSGVRGFDAALDRVFAFGIDPVDGALPSDRPDDWPTPAQQARYNARVRASLDGGLAGILNDEAGWEGGESPELLLHVAIEHRLMHAETLSYMLHQLPTDKKLRAPQVDVPASGPVEPKMVEIPAGRIALGIPRDAPGLFGWDNEFEAHTVPVPEFSIDAYKITNAQFLEFVRASGYAERSLWDADGWTWRTTHGIHHPLFWKPAAEGWLLRTMFDEIPLPPHWPAYVSHAEAEAYAKWTGKRLPSEAEWQRACYGAPEGYDRAFPWGADPPGAAHGYFDSGRWDPWPVNAFPSAAGAFGVHGMLANGWEWTSSVFAPFPGFERFPFYEGYSANFFDGRHFVMKGGSSRTAACMLRRSFRNWFQPHYQYVYAGFRCAR